MLVKQLFSQLVWFDLQENALFSSVRNHSFNVSSPSKSKITEYQFDILGLNYCV